MIGLVKNETNLKQGLFFFRVSVIIFISPWEG